MSAPKKHPTPDVCRRSFLKNLGAAGAASVVWPRWHADGAPANPITERQRRVYRTAAGELSLALAGQPPLAESVIGLWNDVPAAQSLAERGLIELHKAPAHQDAFEVLMHEGVLYLLGNTPRGLLHAVFAMQEALAAGEKLEHGIRRAGAFHFQQRIFHPRFDAWPGERADVRFIARLGATHCLVCHDWQGNRRSLQGYVTSPIFPNAVDPAEVAQNHASLRHLLEDCSDYGLGAMLWLTELPCQGGPWVAPEKREAFLARFPGDVLSDSGTYEGKVLCFGHPRAQEFYRDLLGHFFADFPEVETLFLFSLDSGGEFCDPERCPRCRGMSRFDQRDRLIRFFIEEGGRVRPGLRVLGTGWEWDRHAAEFLNHQASLPEAAGLYLAAEKDGWQCERQSHDFLREARRVCRERGQTFIGYDNFQWGDDTVHGMGDIQDFPLGIGAKIKRWRALDADGVFDHWGGFGENLWCNAIACREFFLNPVADPDEVCRRIAQRQFGERAGSLAFAAWQALERAHQALSQACTWTPQQWPNWYPCRGTAPLPGAFPSEALRQAQLPPHPDGAVIYNPPGFAEALQTVADAWQQANPHFAEAARLLEDAEKLTDDSPLFYRFWWNGARPSPSRREHLARQQIFVRSIGLTGREIGLQFGLHALWERCSRDPAAYRKQSAAQLSDDASACRSAADFFQAAGHPKDWPDQYRKKAETIERFLKDKPPN